MLNQRKISICQTLQCWSILLSHQSPIVKGVMLLPSCIGSSSLNVVMWFYVHKEAPCMVTQDGQGIRPHRKSVIRGPERQTKQKVLEGCPSRFVAAKSAVSLRRNHTEGQRDKHSPNPPNRKKGASGCSHSRGHRSNSGHAGFLHRMGFSSRPTSRTLGKNLYVERISSIFSAYGD